MDIIISLLPWILFSHLAHQNYTLAAEIGLITTIAIAFPDICKKRPKILLTGTVIFFLIALYISVVPELVHYEIWTRPAAFFFLFAIALISLIIKSPFTYQYSKDSTPERNWNKKSFIRSNYIITIMWTFGFALMGGLSLLGMREGPYQTLLVSWSPLIILLGLLLFTNLYPEYIKMKDFED